MTPTILVVDDEVGMLRILQLMFERANFNVLTAENGEIALRLVKSHRPNIILIDDMMPGISGTQVCKQVKSNPRMASIPVIIHSAGPDILDYEYLREIGADAALRKPCPTRTILSTVEQHLSVGV